MFARNSGDIPFQHLACDSVLLVDPHSDRRAIPLYLLLTLAFSSVFWILIIKSGHVGGGGGSYVAALMWCPASAALLTCLILGRDVKTLGWKWVPRFEVMSYLIPLGYATVAYSIVWITGLGGFYNKQFVTAVGNRFGLGHLPAWVAIAMYFVLSGTTGVIRGCATALGEEIGWRGFLVPELAKRTSLQRPL